MSDLDRLLELARKAEKDGYVEYTPNAEDGEQVFVVVVEARIVIALIEAVKEARRDRDHLDRSWQRTDKALVELESRLRAAEEVINGFRWLGNNLHNIKADPERFEDFYRAALDDVKRYDGEATKE